MDCITPFVNIAFALSSVLATRQLLQRDNSTSDATPITNNIPPLSDDEPSQIVDDVNICMICRSDESKGDPFIKAPCGEHFVCANDIASFFEYAINDESLYPPKCCNQIFLLDEYKDHIPADIASAYHSKEQGEYSILAKYVCRLPSKTPYKQHLTKDQQKSTLLRKSALCPVAPPIVQRPRRTLQHDLRNLQGRRMRQLDMCTLQDTARQEQPNTHMRLKRHRRSFQANSS